MKYVPIIIAIIVSVSLSAPASETVSLEGKFNWMKEKEKQHDLKAVFTPKGKNKWDVVYKFKWGNEQEIWKGEATGSLDNGAFKGGAFTDGGKRTFSYSGFALDGVITCKHKQLTRYGKKNEKDTGEFTLSRKSKNTPR